ncbi:MAG: Na+/H+ antiporter NhaC family protein [Bacteroidota bacterium]
MDYGFLSIIPPIIAIALAIWSRQILFSLFAGLAIGWIIIEGHLFRGMISTIDSFVKVFESAGSTRTIIFTLLIGALIQLIRYSGGISGFIHRIQKAVQHTENPRKKLQITAGIAGFLIFIESNISILTVGTVFRPLFDRFGISKEKLAYIVDSSSAPSCILIPVNAWGAYIMGLLIAFEGVPPLKTLIYSIPFNFYPITTLILLFTLTAFNKNIGTMRQFEQKALDSHEGVEPTHSNESYWDMVIPLLVMICSMPLFLMYTGWDSELIGSLGDKIWHAIGNGSGSMSVLLALILAWVVAGTIYGIKKKINLETFTSESLKGMGDMINMALLMVMAFALGHLCNELGTGSYVASITAQWIYPPIIPAVVFLTSCFIAFSTGTSWGTFAIMLSIAVPVSLELGINIYVMTAAVLGGGVFGDHCSPISDTTLIASVASGSDHIDHVRSQLPYALISGAISLFFYLIVGFLIT